MRPQALCFDLWGTLLPTRQPRYGALLAEVALVLAVQPSEFAQVWAAVTAAREVHWEGTIASDIDDALRHLGAFTHLDQRLDATGRLFDYERRALNASAEALDLVRELRSRCILVGVVANATSTTDRLWPDSALASLVDAALFSCLAGARQPAPTIYAALAERLGVAPESCLFVSRGDGGELEGAAAAGMSAVRLVTGGGPASVEWSGPAIHAIGEVLGLVATHL